MLGTVCAVSRQRCTAGGRGGGRHFPFRKVRLTARRIPRTLSAHCRQCFSGVLRFQLLVIRVGEFSRRAIELDFLERAQGDSLRAHVVFGIVSFIGNASLLVARQGRPQDGEQDEIRRSRSKQDTDQQLNQFRRAVSLGGDRARRAGARARRERRPAGQPALPERRLVIRASSASASTRDRGRQRQAPLPARSSRGD